MCVRRPTQCPLLKNSLPDLEVENPYSSVKQGIAGDRVEALQYLRYAAMIDSIILKPNTLIDSSFLSGREANVPFTTAMVPGFTCRILTTEPESPYYKRDRLPYCAKLRNSEKGISLQGPIDYDRGVWHCRTCRVELRRLLGLPPGWLLADQGDLDAAIAAMRNELRWLPTGTLETAPVREIHLTMNFDLRGIMSADEIIAAHALVRHSRVRKDSSKCDPDHNTLYWRGTNLIIAMYEKTQQSVAKFATDKGLQSSEVRARYNLPELLRLEFRVKSNLLSKLFDKVTQPAAPLDGGPPLPANPSPVRLISLNQTNLTALFRELVWEFGDPPVPVIQRLSTRKFLAMLIREKAVLGDGTPVVEFASRYLNRKQITLATGDAREVDTGGPRFNWRDVLGPEGFGEHAFPKPEMYRDLA